MRPITLSIANILDSGSFTTAILVKIVAGLDVVRTHNGIGRLSVNSEIYEGLGQYGSVDVIQQGLEGKTDSVNLRLSGIDPTIANMITGDIDALIGAPTTISLAFISPSTYTVTDDPLLFFSGFISEAIASSQRGSADVIFTLDQWLTSWDKPNPRRFTDADHQKQYPGDLFFQFVGAVGSTDVAWGGDNRPTLDKLRGLPRAGRGADWEP